MKRSSIKIPPSVSGNIGGFLFKLLNMTWRAPVLTFPEAEEDRKAFDSPCILVFWHGQQLLMPNMNRYMWRGYTRRKIMTLISGHRDGRMVAIAVKKVGIDSIAGSSTEGGDKALRQMVRVLRDGEHVAITPDGPRGPLHKMKPGAIKLAQLTGFPIITMSASARRVWKFKSWDGMILPKPFSKLSGVFGAPVYVERTASEEEFASILQKLENQLQKNAERAHATAQNYK